MDQNIEDTMHVNIVIVISENDRSLIHVRRKKNKQFSWPCLGLEHELTTSEYLRALKHRAHCNIQPS